MTLRILALHGYTQSGACFQKKLRKLEIRLREEFGDVSFHFETAPIKLNIRDMVSTVISQKNFENDDEDDTGQREPDTDDTECHAWFKLEDQEPPMGFVHSLDMLSKCLEDHGPFDGVLGFSQGGLMAIMLASLLEGEIRKEAFSNAKQDYSGSFTFPESFKNIEHPPLKFGITYGALMGVTKTYAPFYESPQIQTPFCLFSGLYDPVVSQEMANKVKEAGIGGSRSIQILHPGAHIVCLERKYIDAVVDFVKDVRAHNIAPILEIPSSVDQKVTQEKCCMRESDSGSTSSVSEESPASSKPAYVQRRTKILRYKGTKSFWRSIQRGHQGVHAESSSSDTSISSADEGYKPTRVKNHLPWLANALDTFIDELIQVETSHGRSPPLMATQEIAARILSKHIG